MSSLSAQISIYPLRRQSIGESIERALSAIRAHNVNVTTGFMSTVIAGEENEVFSALRDCFRAACAGGNAVMVVTVSNACPVGAAADQEAVGQSGQPGTAEAHDV